MRASPSLAPASDIAHSSAWSLLANLPLLALARRCGLVRRRPRKVYPLAFLQTSCLLSLVPNVSLSGWAGLWGLFNAQTLSKQAVAKRFSPAAVAFLKETLGALMSGLCLQPLTRPRLPRSFHRVLLQDSTCVSLPQKLAAKFPGSFSHSHGRSATLKIQAVYDLMAHNCVHFSLGSFSQNDQRASPAILAIARTGDLVIRDLGYAVLEVFQQFQAQGIYFLSRWLPGTTVLDPQTGQKLDLQTQLRTLGKWDGPVWLGQDKRVPARLVALPVPEPVAAERRRKLKASRDRRSRPSSERLALCSWDIFITNVSPAVWSPDALPAVYALRWRIEILFKSWKSHFRLEALTAGSAQQIEVLIYGRLIWICLFHLRFVGPHSPAPALSVMKLAAWSQSFWLPCLLAMHGVPTDQNLRLQIAYHGRYEKRKKRKNFYQKLFALG
jgi:hypothetical protein